MARYKRGYRPRRRSGSVFTIFVLIVLLAVAAGYAGTKYIIYPYFLQGEEAEGSINSENQEGSDTDSGMDVTASPPSLTIDSQETQANSENNQEETQSAQGTGGGNNKEQGHQEGSTAKGPFTVQFGTFSTRDAADLYAKELTRQGIYTYIYEDDGAFKVLGLPYGEKAKAQEAVSVISPIVEDAFVVDMSTL